MRSSVALLALAVLASPVLADTLFLKGGGRVEGTITKENAREVVIRVSGGTMTVPRKRIEQIRRDGEILPPRGEGPTPPPEEVPPGERPMAYGVREQVRSCLADLASEDSRLEREALQRLPALSPSVTSLALRREIGGALLDYLSGYDGRSALSVKGALERYLDVVTPAKLLSSGQGGKTSAREVVVGLLRQVPGRSAADALVSLLTDESSRIRGQAFAALHGRNDAADSLTRLLGHEDADVRGPVLTLLLTLDGREVAGALCRSLPAAEEADRIRMVSRLSSLKNPVAYETLAVRLTRDTSPEVRRICADALARLGGPDVEARLESALSVERIAKVKRAIQGALAMLAANGNPGANRSSGSGGSGSGRSGSTGGSRPPARRTGG